MIYMYDQDIQGFLLDADERGWTRIYPKEDGRLEGRLKGGSTHTGCSVGYILVKAVDQQG